MDGHIGADTQHARQLIISHCLLLLQLGFDDMFGLCPRDRDDGFCPFTLRELLSIARLSKALVKGLEGLKAAELAALKLLTEIGTLGVSSIRRSLCRLRLPCPIRSVAAPDQRR